MKKLLFIFIGIMAFVLPSLAQAINYDQYQQDRLVYLKIPKDQVPEVVSSAINVKFDRNNPVTWSKFPFALEKFGWVYDIGSDNLDLDRYEVIIKTFQKTDFTAVYTKSGELIQSREMISSMRIPSYIMDEFQKSNYNDWKIIDNKEIISFYRNPANNSGDVEQAYSIKVEKEGVKRTLTYKWKGSETYPAYYTNIDHYLKSLQSANRLQE